MKNPASAAYAVKALLGYWGELSVGDITPQTCDGYRRKRAAGGVSDGTVRRDLGVLRAAIRHAHKEGRLTEDRHVELPKMPEGRDRFLTRDEAAALLWEARRDPRARGHLPLFILLGLYTGARKGAILSLRWHQIDLAHGRIDFAAGSDRVTNKRRARQPIPRRLMTFLKLAYRRGGSDLGHVLHQSGHPIGDIKKGFAGAAGRAGLTAVTPHTLRHTCACWLAQRGVPLHDIAGWLGHTTARTTELYAHHHPDHLDRPRRAIDER